MKLLKKVPEAAMVAAFLKAEYSSPRFKDDLKKAMQSLAVDEAVITYADTTSKRSADRVVRSAAFLGLKPRTQEQGPRYLASLRELPKPGKLIRPSHRSKIHGLHPEAAHLRFACLQQ